MKKKLYSLITIFIMAMLVLTACGKAKPSENKSSSEKATENVAVENTKEDKKENSETKEKQIINLGSLKGPTSLGLVKLFDESDNNASENSYNYKIYNSPDEVVSAIVKGELDMAAVPANLAAVLYQKTEGKIKVLNINTLGVLYIASKQDIKSINDLKGKTIITSGKGASPEFALRYILKESGIDPDKDLTIEYKAEHTEVVAALAADENSIVMLPEPFLTVAKTKVQGLKTNLSLTELWDNLNNNSKLVTGVMIAKADFIKDHEDAVEEFMEEYEESIEYTNENVSDAAKLSEKYDIVKGPIAEKAIPSCNICFISGDEMKTVLSGYLQTLYDQEPKAVGGKLPDENFYFKES